MCILALTRATWVKNHINSNIPTPRRILRSPVIHQKVLNHYWNAEHSISTTSANILKSNEWLRSIQLINVALEQSAMCHPLFAPDAPAMQSKHKNIVGALVDGRWSMAVNFCFRSNEKWPNMGTGLQLSIKQKEKIMTLLILLVLFLSGDSHYTNSSRH